MTTLSVSLEGWPARPELGLLLPREGRPGWADGAFWAAILEAWGLPVARAGEASLDALAHCTTVVAPALSLDDAATAQLSSMVKAGTSVLLAGPPSLPALSWLGLEAGDPIPVQGIRLDHAWLSTMVEAALPGPDGHGVVALEAGSSPVRLAPDRGWRVLAEWADGRTSSGRGAPAIAYRWAPETEEGVVVWFGPTIETVDWRAAEAIAGAAEVALSLASPQGLIGIWRWPAGRRAALVVDGDVDHPAGVDPECSRYVAPALETAHRAGYEAYGIFVAGANVARDPGAFPAGPGYHNHSYSHPYSYWNPQPWETLDEASIEAEIRTCAETFATLLGVPDRGIFRLPHFQMEGWVTSYSVLDRLGYLAESSVGADYSITAGLPFHPARRSWSDRPADIGYARTHPDLAQRFRILQLPISTDPSDPAFPNGCCSYNALGEGVRRRGATPGAYERVLDDVVRRSLARRSMAHLFIDPPDAGYGRLGHDRVDYAGAVERWLARWGHHPEVAVLTTADLADWWLMREQAVSDLSWGHQNGRLEVSLAEPAHANLTLAIQRPQQEPGPTTWTLLPIGTA